MGVELVAVGIVLDVFLVCKVVEVVEPGINVVRVVACVVTVGGKVDVIVVDVIVVSAALLDENVACLVFVKVVFGVLAEVAAIGRVVVLILVVGMVVVVVVVVVVP